MHFINDWQDCMARVQRDLSSPAPCFLSRIGGSDTNAVAALLEARDAGQPDTSPAVLAHLPIVQRYNGFYDTAQSDATFLRYLETLLGSYERSRSLFVCNFQLLSMYLADTLHPSFFRADIEGRRGFELLVERIGRSSPDCLAYPYQFVEKMASHPLTLLNVLRTTLAGKKVLVVSPFGRSIAANFARRRSFFRDFKYPEFDLQVYNTPITYAGLPRQYYPDHDWFATAGRMKAEIAACDFDVALLSCGSYAMPIGEHVASAMGRQAIYVGGVLQIMFGIMGRRYENPFILDQINRDTFISPVERDDYLGHVSINSDTAHEAFGAYF